MKNFKNTTANPQTNTTETQKFRKSLMEIATSLIGLVTLVVSGRDMNMKMSGEGTGERVKSLKSLVDFMGIDAIHALFNWVVNATDTAVFEKRLAVALIAEKSFYRFSAKKRLSAIWAGFNELDKSYVESVRRGTGLGDISRLFSQLFDLRVKDTGKWLADVTHNCPPSWRDKLESLRPAKLADVVVVATEVMVPTETKTVSTVKVQDGEVKIGTATKMVGGGKKEVKKSGFSALQSLRSSLPATRPVPKTA